MNTGIYIIVNNINKKFYIGSAINLSSRKSNHFSKLTKNIHVNKHLQSSFNKYGANNFTFYIIQYVKEKTQLIENEQYWLDTLKPDYNIAKIAGSVLGFKHSDTSKLKISEKNKGNTYSLGYKHTEETCRKRSIASTGNKGNKGGIISKEHKEKIIKFLTGRKHSAETKAKIAEKARLQHVRQNVIKQDKFKP